MREERILLVLAVITSLCILGDSIRRGHKWDLKLDHIEATLEQVEASNEEQALKNTVRDVWMVKHQTELMERLEGRSCDTKRCHEYQTEQVEKPTP